MQMKWVQEIINTEFFYIWNFVRINIHSFFSMFASLFFN